MRDFLVFLFDGHGSEFRQRWSARSFPAELIEASETLCTKRPNVNKKSLSNNETPPDGEKKQKQTGDCDFDY